MSESNRLVGLVMAACWSERGGVPKLPRQEVEVGPEGIVGDYHAGPINRHKKRGAPEPNRRQVTVVAHEVIEDVNRLLGLSLGPGALAENFLVTGLGDLSDLKAGDRISLGSALLEVTGQNAPCATVGAYHPLIVKQLQGRRGVACIVREPGTVHPGDAATILRARSAALARAEGVEPEVY